MARVTKGIDLSTYDRNLNYETLCKQIDYAILRCGYTGYGAGKTKSKDVQFENHYKGCKGQGLAMGAYYYSCATTEAEAIAEANFVIEALKGKEFTYPIYMDVEDDHHMKALSSANLSKVVLAFCRTLEAAGYYVGIYANTNWWRTELDQTMLKSIDKWVAHYGVNTPGVVGEMWQYTENGKLNGFSQSFDLNYCYKDYPAIIKKAGLNGFGVPTKPPEIIIKGEGEDGDKLKMVLSLLEHLGFTVVVEEI